MRMAKQDHYHPLKWMGTADIPIRILQVSERDVAASQRRVPCRFEHCVKMNLHSVLLNDNFAFESFAFICATPLEQFQILPLSAQIYPASASISSLEQCNLFPQVATSSEFVYMSGAGLAAKLTS
jgi:hypothetical protein